MSLHAMIDLETLDVRPSAAVLTIGAVKFNPYTNDEPFDEFYCKVDVDQQTGMGRTVDDNTIEWWGKQDPKIMEEAFDPKARITYKRAIDDLAKWVWGAEKVWGHGYGFDITMLEDMFRQCERPIPWQFWQVMDSRTLFNVLKNGDPRKRMQTDLHNALSDAYYQAKSVQIAYNELGVTNG